MVIMVGWAIAGYGDGQDLALVVALYSVGRYTADHRYSLATVAAAVTVSVLDTIIDTNQRIDIAPAILLGVLPWYVGRRVRNRGDYVALLRERAERLEADHLARARQAVADERSRIARKLHDVVAHQVSMMTVQACAAKTIARDDLDAAVDAMGDVERAGRQALGELRHLLGVLASGTPRASMTSARSQGSPASPTLADELTRTGADVSLTMAACPRKASPLPSTCPPTASSSESPHQRHPSTAGPDPTVHLTEGWTHDDLVIRHIVNTITPSGSPRGGGGTPCIRIRHRLDARTRPRSSAAP